MFEFIITFIRSLFGIKQEYAVVAHSGLQIVYSENDNGQRDGDCWNPVVVTDHLTYSEAYDRAFDEFESETVVVEVNGNRINVQIEVEDFSLVRKDGEWTDETTGRAPKFSLVF